MRVDTLLTELLNATAAKTAASRRVERLRDRLDREARRRYAEEGAAPSWKAPSLGTVRLDPKPAAPYIDDPAAFASYVAERFPTEVTASLELDAAQLAAALEALEFAGVTVTRSTVDVRQSFAKALLDDAEVIYAPDPTDCAVMRRLDDTGTVEPIPGTAVLEPSATLVVTLDRDAKARTLATVDAELDLAEATGRPVTTVSLDEAVALADQPADALERAVVEELVTDEAGSIAERQRQASAAHAAKIGENLRDFAERNGPGNLERAAGGLEPVIRTGHDAQEAELERQRADREPVADDAILNEFIELGATHGTHGATDLDDVTTAPVAESDAPVEEATVDELKARLESTLDEADLEADTGLPLEDHVAIIGGGLRTPTATDLVAVELAKLGTDDLKRAARVKRLPVSGTKVLLASRLAKAGVAPDDVLALSARA